MSYKSAIEWTETTWNPVTGCTKITRGCDNCYAERLAERFRGTPGHVFERGFDLTLRPERLSQPLSWKRPRVIFVNSMSDLFHKDVPPEFIDNVFDTMEEADWHTFQILSKAQPAHEGLPCGADTDRTLCQGISGAGVSVEDNRAAARIQHLQESPISIRFLSIEPLLGPIGNIDIEGISWVIVGGESGPNARPMKPHWVFGVRDLCERKKVPFFFKQWGGRTSKSGGRLLNGIEHNAMPVYLQQK